MPAAVRLALAAVARFLGHGGRTRVTRAAMSPRESGSCAEAMSWGIAVKQHGKKKVNERGRAWRGRDRGVGEEGRRDPGREGTRRRGRGEGSVGGKTRERDMEKMQQETPNKGHEEGGGREEGGEAVHLRPRMPLGPAGISSGRGCRELRQLGGGTCGRRGRK